MQRWLSLFEHLLGLTDDYGSLGTSRPTESVCSLGLAEGNGWDEEWFRFLCPLNDPRLLLPVSGHNANPPTPTNQDGSKISTSSRRC